MWEGGKAKKAARKVRVKDRQGEREGEREKDQNQATLLIITEYKRVVVHLPSTHLLVLLRQDTVARELKADHTN